MKHLLRIESLIHVVMVAFAATSLTNVQMFLQDAGHPSPAAWALSIALGLGLVTISIMLTHVDRDTEQTAFKWLLASGVALGVISGSMQAAEYSKHLGWFWPILLGYGVPLCGEVLLAWATSSYTKARRRAQFRNVGEQVEQAVSTHLQGAIDSFDPSKIQKHLQRTIDTMAMMAVNSVSSKAMQFYDAPAGTSTPDKEESTDTDITPNVTRTDGNLEYANAVRLSKKSAKMDKTFTLIQCGDRPLSTIADEVGVSEKTITRYIDDFRQQGHRVTVNGTVKLA